MTYKYQTSIGLRRSVFETLDYLKRDDESWEDLLIFLVSKLEEKRKDKIQEDMRIYKEQRMAREKENRKMTEREMEREFEKQLNSLESKTEDL